MIAWWAWVLLWLLLVVAAALFVVLCGIRLYRGLMRLMDDASTAMDRLHLPEPAPGGGRYADPDGAAGPASAGSAPAGSAGAGRPAVGVAALFRDPVLARREYDDAKAARREARRVRRVERKRRNGQPQRMRDLRTGAVDL